MTFPRPRLLALDLDGTLLDAQSQLPDAHMETVQWAKAHQIEVAIVTGRPLLTTRWVWDRLGLDTPVVCFNGVWVGVPGEEPLACEALEEDEVHRIVASLAKQDGAICVYPGVERWLIHRFTPRTAGFTQLYGVTIEESPELLKQWQGPSCKVMFVTEPHLLKEQLAAVKADLGDEFHIVASQEDRFEIHRHGVTKAWGLSRLASIMGIDQENVWAAGDANNDLEMVSWAGVGCAMGHAPQGLRDRAQLVLPSIHEHGLQGLVSHMQDAIA